MGDDEHLYGTRQPTGGTPGRAPGSVRRTTSMDALHPEGLNGPLLIVGRGRDLLTARRGRPTVVAEAHLRVNIEFPAGPSIAGIEVHPDLSGVAGLVGKRPSAGFRSLIDETTSAVHGSLLYLLLDDIPVSTLVSGYALHSQGDTRPAQPSKRKPPGPALQFPDLCAGYQVGGVILTSLERDGRQPISVGPPAPEVADLDDPLSWHDLPTLEAHGVRRRRRQDVMLRNGEIVVDAFFRDSYMAPDGRETVIHEYSVNATVDPTAMTVTQCRATPRVLPWRECPQAAESAGRLAGMSLIALRRQVRDELLGPTTCTHLNDTLRGLGDVDHLSRSLDGPAA